MKRNPELLAAIVADPDNLSARQVYADWWLEQGDARGDFVSATLTLTGRIDPATRKIAQRRVTELFAQHRLAWAEDLEALGARDLRFSLGFIAELTLAEANLDALEKLLALEPITHLQVRLDSGARLALAMRAPAFDRIEHLTLHGNADAWCERVEKPSVKRLQGVILKDVTSKGVRALAQRAELAGLERLSITGTDAGDDALSALGKGRLRLKTLYAARCGLTDEGVAALVGSEGAASLEHLALGGNELTDEVFEALVESEHLGRLQRLELGGTEISDEGLAALADPEVLPSLQALDMKGVWVTPALRAKLHARKCRVS